MDKQQANGSGETLVTFRLPADVGATAVSVVGEFNGWSPDAHRMRREDDAFTAGIPLVPGRAYRFRYRLDGERWLNDWPPTPTCLTSLVARIPSSISLTCHLWNSPPTARPPKS
jgi:1,4-alpha-glucan branching enzyme